MDATNQLGDFLRACRERVRPEDVGLGPGVGLRRVPGLRREEVAMLAGISADYYLRLEQGRLPRRARYGVGTFVGAARLDRGQHAGRQPDSRRAGDPARLYPLE